MAVNIKDLGELERDILKHSSKASPVLVLDTGALIDIVHATRDFNLYANGRRETHPHYLRATSFLKNVSSRIPLVITPKTYQEIQNHGGMRLNSHITELSPAVVNYSLDIMLDSARFMDRLVVEVPFDDVRYDAHWASLEGCNGSPKKKQEGCSDTDREILSFAAYLSLCKHPSNPGIKINPVLVVSPDLHIIHGSEFLRREFDGRYSNIVPISTRD